MEYRNRVAFITGGASGIGLGIADALASRGCHIVLADIQADALSAAEQALNQYDCTILPLHLDVANREQVYAAAGRVAARFPHIDLLFNNAGIGDAGSPLPTMNDNFFDWIMKVNVTGCMNVLKACIPLIQRSASGGHIVNTASMAALVVTPGWNQGLYSATKMAVLALSLDLRDALASEGIGVSTLCPGLVSTNIAETALKLRPKQAGSHVPDVPDMLKASGMSPAEAALITLDGIDRNLPIIVTHPELWPEVERFHQVIKDAFFVEC